MRGVTPAKLRGRVARWQNAETDLIGPAFAAAWGGSPEAAAEAERERAYAESLRERLWGTSDEVRVVADADDGRLDAPVTILWLCPEVRGYRRPGDRGPARPVPPLRTEPLTRPPRSG